MKLKIITTNLTLYNHFAIHLTFSRAHSWLGKTAEVVLIEFRWKPGKEAYPFLKAAIF